MSRERGCWHLCINFRGQQPVSHFVFQVNKVSFFKGESRWQLWKHRPLAQAQRDTWPIFTEIIIGKSSKNDEEVRSHILIQPAYRPEIEFKVSFDVIQLNLQILWRLKQLWTRFPGDQLILPRCESGLHFWSSCRLLSRQKLDKNLIPWKFAIPCNRFWECVQ